MRNLKNPFLVVFGVDAALEMRLTRSEFTEVPGNRLMHAPQSVRGGGCDIDDTEHTKR